jgi:hypothetical protein
VAGYHLPLPHRQAQWRYADWVECCIRRNSAQFQLHPLVVPQDSQTKQEPAGRIRTPQVEQKGASTAAIPGVNASSLRGEAGATVGMSSTSEVEGLPA